ncbi:MAG: PilZ domain-containing protein [Pseudoalteromonas sp.]|uniref:PilZ domain-containing protein n=1 Tax=unclassified Pseudoalteromonas TaxID=194690 RepID=UPI000C08D29C|nr:MULTISPECIES: PilZ domain-containing protein [unclassified Pseudoalteromonas]MDP2635024.1 PilZ domain-containing protein [Pseudoalteromonas sp. 1_MG-2023]PHN89530.1 PilZ domain-containing protein [Pseudoalteromonas sp. 3D05]TGE85780.1 PilZ domain-containing protein [Pseudoalteromonas sp. KS88]
MLNEDQRNFRRMQINAKATLTTLEPIKDEHYDALCVDLSATGLSLQLDDLLEIGTIVKVKIDSTSPTIAPLDAVAKVIRASKEEDGTITAGLEIMQFN